jgi:hypothetical protein
MNENSGYALATIIGALIGFAAGQLFRGQVKPNAHSVAAAWSRSWYAAEIYRLLGEAYFQSSLVLAYTVLDPRNGSLGRKLHY